MSALSERALRRDRRAVSAAADAPASEVPALGALLANLEAPWEAREIAASCLAQMTAPEAASALVPALLDPQFQVRAAACRGVVQRATPAQQADLLAAHDQSAVPFVREQVALAIGRLDAAADVPAMRERWAHADAPTVTAGWTAALARVGDPDARRAFVRGLHAALGGADVRRWLDYCEYIRAPWLLPALRPALDDETAVGFRANDDPEQPPPSALRACDVALELVAKISGRRFAFTADEPRAYTPAELREARALLDALPPAE